MKWTNPVTNKTNENYMNVSDFKRIAGNIEYTYFGLSVGASVPTPDTVAPFVEKFNALAADSLIYKDEFNTLVDFVNDLIEEYNKILYSPIEPIVYPTTIDAAYMNNMEMVFRKYKVNIFAGWGL